MTALWHGDDPRLRRRSPREGRGRAFYGYALKRMLEAEAAADAIRVDDTREGWTVGVIGVICGLVLATMIVWSR